MWVLLKAPTIRRSQVMEAITTIGLDIAKSVFQVHGVDAEGNVVLSENHIRTY
jgi:transposase